MAYQAISRGDLRPTHYDADARHSAFQLPGNPQGSLDVPEVTGKTHHPRLALGHGQQKIAIAEGIGLVSQEDVDVVESAEPLLQGPEFQIARDQRHIASNRFGTERRNRELNQPNRT